MSLDSLCTCTMTVTRAVGSVNDASGGPKTNYQIVDGMAALRCSAQKQTAKLVDALGARNVVDKYDVYLPGTVDIQPDDRLFVTFPSQRSVWLTVVSSPGDAAGRSHHTFLTCEEFR